VLELLFFVESMPVKGAGARRCYPAQWLVFVVAACAKLLNAATGEDNPLSFLV